MVSVLTAFPSEQWFPRDERDAPRPLLSVAQWFARPLLIHAFQMAVGRRRIPERNR
jgi:hypothetical protein